MRSSSPPPSSSARAARRLGLGLALLLAVVAAACGSDAAGSDDAGAAEPGADGFPVTVEHKFGTTEIAAAPQRVVALGYTELDYLLALGVTPVAARYPQFGDTSTAVRSWAAEAADGADPEVLDFAFGELGYEAIAALEPDLIMAVTAGITDEEYETLSAIAPTVAQTDAYIDFGMPWQDTTRLVGEAVGRSDEAEALVEDVEARVTAVREAHPEFAGRTLASAYYGADEVMYFASEDLRARFFTDLGFTMPAALDDLAEDEFYGSFSPERLDLLDADVLVWSQLQFTEGGREAIEADPVVQGLDAVRDGRVLYIGGEADDALQVSTVLSLPVALEGIVPLLERATDDDPATAP